MNKFNGQIRYVTIMRYLDWHYIFRLDNELTHDIKRSKWRFIWNIYFLECVKVNSENKYYVGLVAEHFSWSDIKRDVCTWGNQITADKMNIMKKNGFGMQNKVINNNNFGHVTDYTHVWGVNFSSKDEIMTSS